MHDAIVVSCACFGTMAIGYGVSKAGIMGDDTRKGVSHLYTKLAFPAMVFRGVAAIDVSSVEPTMLLLILAAKLIVIGACLAFGLVCHTPEHGLVGALAHAATYAMAATHSFDVTLGVPLAGELFPADIPYIYMNQSVQLVLLNPLLLAAIALGGASAKGAGKGGGGGGGTLRRVVAGVLTNPIVKMTVAGLVAGRVWPGGLPAPLRALSKQLADAGPFLGFLSLGFAMAALKGTTHSIAMLCCAVLCCTVLCDAMLCDAMRCDGRHHARRGEPRRGARGPQAARAPRPLRRARRRAARRDAARLPGLPRRPPRLALRLLALPRQRPVAIA